MNVRTAFVAALVLCAACSGKSPQPPPPSARPLLIESRGVVMPLAEAVKTVGFVPFIPSAQLISVAVIPPLSDAAGRSARPGIAMEYESGGDALLLSQWTRGGLNIAVGTASATSRPCAPIAYKADCLLWATRDGRVMTLQPDGTVFAPRLTREADRLLRAGACGRRTRTLSRPLPSPSRAVSSPRRSAF